jgi:Rab-like protein 3
MAAAEKIKVLVLGDSGVGKSSLVHLICHSQPITSPSWTIGCSIDVKLHEYKEGTPQQRSYFIELWDIGGSRSHSIARSVFYSSFHGIILVHDITNRKSQLNLRKWLGHVFYSKDSQIKENQNINASTISAALFPVAPNDDYEFDMESFFERNIPVLVVATKPDLAQSTRRSPSYRGCSVAEECGAEEIQIDCHQAKSLAPGSTNAVKLSRFFDKVAERKFNHHNHNSTPHYKRHANVIINKFSHVD